MKQTVGNLSFNSKKELEDYTRKLLKDVGFSIIGPRSEAFDFLSELLKRHESFKLKEGTGIDYFFTRPGLKGVSSYVMRTDGTVVDFSWKSCCSQRFKDDNGLLNEALRVAIEPWTSQFKLLNLLVCALCGSSTSDEYHTDHKDKPFSLIRDDFLKTKKKIPTLFDDDPASHRAIFRFEDRHFKDAWINYHNQNASYQILCSSCNCKKSNK